MSRLPDPARAELWKQRFDRLSQSDLTIEQFCKQEAINVSSFYQWKKKLAAPGHVNIFVPRLWMLVSRGFLAFDLRLGLQSD